MQSSCPCKEDPDIEVIIKLLLGYCFVQPLHLLLQVADVDNIHCVCPFGKQ